MIALIALRLSNKLGRAVWAAVRAAVRAAAVRPRCHRRGRRFRLIRWGPRCWEWMWE
jgi:hypothetical protein